MANALLKPSVVREGLGTDYVIMDLRSLEYADVLMMDMQVDILLVL